jgi:hypothetical protein
MLSLFPSRALRVLFSHWPAPCSEPIPAEPGWHLRTYIAWRILNDPHLTSTIIRTSGLLASFSR